MNHKSPITRSVVKLATFVASILLIPLVSMQFSENVDWTLSDFVFAGILLFASGLTYIFISRLSEDHLFKTAVGLSIISGLFLIWSNLAVGIIGSENNPFNLLYFLVIFTGIIGAIASKFRSKGLSITLFSMAFAQAAIAIAALIIGLQNDPFSSVYEIVAVNGFFITLFVVSGLLFFNVEVRNQKSKPMTE